MSINGKLTRFSQQDLVISRTDKEREKLKRSLNHLKKALKDQLGGDVQEIMEFGSYTRNTILPRKYDPGSDIDLMIIMNTQNHELTPGTYRTWLKNVLANTYQNSLSKKDFPAVKLELKDIKFDLVPAIKEEGWWNGTTYYIPDSGDGWQKTTPKDIDPELAKANQLNGSNTVRNVIRLCKHWNAKKARPRLSSYLMETDIINRSRSLWTNWQDTYEGFLDALNYVAGDQAGVRQAIQNIREYEGNWRQEANEAKQLKWLRNKLLPGLPE